MFLAAKTGPGLHLKKEVEMHEVITAEGGLAVIPVLLRLDRIIDVADEGEINVVKSLTSFFCVSVYAFSIIVIRQPSPSINTRIYEDAISYLLLLIGHLGGSQPTGSKNEICSQKRGSSFSRPHEYVIWHGKVRVYL